MPGICEYVVEGCYQPRFAGFLTRQSGWGLCRARGFPVPSSDLDEPGSYDKVSGEGESDLQWYFDAYSRTFRADFHATNQAETNPTNNETQDNKLARIARYFLIEPVRCL